jgi:hypothetical protein
MNAVPIFAVSFVRKGEDEGVGKKREREKKKRKEKNFKKGTTLIRKKGNKSNKNKNNSTDP